MDEETDVLDLAPEAPAWRKLVARAIDLVAAFSVLSLFLTPIVAVQTHRGSTSSLLQISALVYVAVFAVLAVSWIAGRRRKRPYVTVGMSVMRLYPVRTGKTTRTVSKHDVQAMDGDAKWGRAAAAIALPLIVAAAVFLVFELIAYT